MIRTNTVEGKAEQTWRKDYGDVSWEYESDRTECNQTKSPFVHLSTPNNHPTDTAGWEELNEEHIGVRAALSVLESYEWAVRFAQRVPNFSWDKVPLSCLRYISEEEVIDAKRRWDDFVLDLTKKDILCHSPSTSVESLSDSDPPLPTTPKTTSPPPAFEHFQLNSAAAPFVPRDFRLGSPGAVYPTSFHSPSAKDDFGSYPPLKSLGEITNKRRPSSRASEAGDDSRVSPSPDYWGGRLASSSSSSDLSSMSNGDTPSLVADEDGWIVMEPEQDKRTEPKKSPKSKKSRKQQVQLISFPSLLPPPPGKYRDREKEAPKNKRHDDEGWMECSANGVMRPSSPKQQKGRHNKTRSSVSTAATLNRGHVRQTSMPLQNPVPPHSQNGYYYPPHPGYPPSGYMLPSPYQSFQAMLPIVPVAVPPPNGWVLYPTMA